MPTDEDREIDPSKPMSLDDALLLGTRLQRVLRLDQAHAVYTAVLQAAPEHPMALQFLGILEHQRNNAALALDYMNRALVQAPSEPGLHLNHGNMLLEMQRFDEAAEAYERCAELGGKSAALLTNIGALRHCQGRHDAAEAAFREALAIDPTFAKGYHGYGLLLAHQGRHEEALAQHAAAFERDPTHANSRHQVGLTLAFLGRIEEAAQVYREWLAAEPDNPRPKHYLAACTGESVPERAPVAYVTATFDHFAQSFDYQLDRLQYRGPALVGEAVRALLGEPRADLDVLDAGCGTGLCAPMLAPFARRLVGVDLSGGMLSQARERGGYHALVNAELTEFMFAHPQTFDLIASADTLIYFGELGAFCRAAFATLRPGGRLVYTVEALPDAPTDDGQGFKLTPSGRYAHGRAYVQQAAAAAGFDDVAVQEIVVRTEWAVPVRGFLVAARRV